MRKAEVLGRACTGGCFAALSRWRRAIICEQIRVQRLCGKEIIINPNHCPIEHAFKLAHASLYPFRWGAPCCISVTEITWCMGQVRLLSSRGWALRTLIMSHPGVIAGIHSVT